MAIVSPPRLVGIAVVAKFLGVSRWWLYDHGPALPGYVGMIGRRHTWNFPELIASTYDSDASVQMVVDRLTDPNPSDPLDTLLCAVPDCDYPAEQIGLCDKHLRRLFTAWRRAGRSTVVTMQLVAMCRWVVDRKAHLVLPAGFDPWANVCMTPGCGNSTNTRGENAWHGPLCVTCSAQLWNHVGRPRRRPDGPNHWKQTRTA